MFQRAALLLMLCLDQAPSSFVAGQPVNDECNAATQVTSIPFSANEDTTTATADFDEVAGTSNFTCAIKPEARGVWFSYEGQDNFVEAIISDSEGSNVDFTTALFTGELSGSDCSELSCVLPSEYTRLKQSTEPTNHWFASAGVLYSLLVTGVDADAVGAFDLVIQDAGIDLLPNDRCENALAYENLNFPAQVNTAGARPGLSNSDCGIVDQSRGAYYQFEGTGGKVSIKVSKLVHLYDEEGHFEIAVFSGRCDALACVKFEDFIFSDEDATLEVASTTNGVTYTVLVTGQAYSDVGTFEITIEKVEDGTSGAHSVFNYMTFVFSLVMGFSMLAFF